MLVLLFLSSAANIRTNIYSAIQFYWQRRSTTVPTSWRMGVW